jgi:BlaI family penicillinase repressor
MGKSRSEGFKGISDAELTVLELLWGGGPATPNALQEKAGEEGTDWAYTTVQTLLHRLLEKGYVSRRREGATRVYEATVDREQLVAAHMDDLAERLCGGAATPLLLSLARSKRISKSDLTRFRKILEDSGTAKRKRKKRGR